MTDREGRELRVGDVVMYDQNPRFVATVTRILPEEHGQNYRPQAMATLWPYGWRTAHQSSPGSSLTFLRRESAVGEGPPQ